MPVSRLLALALSTLLVSAAQADTITSSASSAASHSVGSLSDSVSGSSKSSSGGDAQVAAGPYRVTAVAAVDGDRVRLQLTPAAGQATGFALTLPAPVAAAQTLAPGATLHVTPRDYGLAFAAQAGGAPFFLAVDDRLRRDFDSVKL